MRFAQEDQFVYRSKIFFPLKAFESPMKFLSGSITCKSDERRVSDLEARVRAGFLTVWLPYSMPR